MSRIIKFRAWDKKHNKMRYLGVGDSFRFWPGGSWAVVNTVYLPGTLVTDNKKAILMQYTGLKDKNGKEIYEGDVVAIPDRIHHVVGFDDGMFIWDNIRPNNPIIDNLKEHKCEVIGNIHENPELLKEK